MRSANANDAPPTPSAEPDLAVGGHTVRRNALYALLGNGVLNACRLASFALIAKFTNPEVYGRYFFANNALAQPIVLYFAREARAAYVSDARGLFPFGAYRALRRTTLAAAALVLAGALVIVGWREPLAASIAMMAIVCLGRIVYFLAEVDWGVYQRRERLDLMAVSNAWRGVLMLACYAGGLGALTYFWRAGSLSTATYAWIVAACAAVHVAAWIGVWRLFDERQVQRSAVDLGWTWTQVRALAAQTWPLGLVHLLIALADAIPQWVILIYHPGYAEIGYYGAIKAVAMIASFTIIQVGTAAGNRLAQSYQHDRAAFKPLVTKLMLFAAALAVAMFGAAILFGRPILTLLFTNDYAAYFSEFLILMGGNAVLLIASITGFVVTSMRKFWVQVPIQVVIVLATTVASFWLIPNDAVGGAAWASVVRSLTHALLYGTVIVALIRQPRANLNSEPSGDAGADL